MGIGASVGGLFDDKGSKQLKKAKTKAGQTKIPYPPKIKSSIFIINFYPKNS